MEGRNWETVAQVTPQLRRAGDLLIRRCVGACGSLSFLQSLPVGEYHAAYTQWGSFKWVEVWGFSRDPRFEEPG